MTSLFSAVGASLQKNLINNASVRTLYSRLRGNNSFFQVLKCSGSDRYIDFDIKLDFTFEQGKHYQYSKLYYSTGSDTSFDESRVICFQPVRRQQFEKIRLALPDYLPQCDSIFIRIDGLPYSEGEYEVRNVQLVDGLSDQPLSRMADWYANRQRTRSAVQDSEARGAGLLPHYPESVSLELTPRCNLTCPHCSSHGTTALHKHHNRLPEMTMAQLEEIAHETFPHITALSLVGRGEPSMVSHPLWLRMAELVRHYGVRISCVTNGHFIRQRFTEDLIPYVDEICVSMDGNSQEVHGFNRGGSSLEKVMDNIAWFHELRQKASLARRPKLSIYWTLMTNNLHELPEFIREAERFSPDYFAIRHLVVFHDNSRERSLLGHPEKVNHYLKEAYAELHRQGIDFEAPPLMDETQSQSAAITENIIARVPVETGSVRVCAPDTLAESPDMPVVSQDVTVAQKDSAAPIPEISSSSETAASSEKPDDAILCNRFEELDEDYLAEHCTWMYRTGIISYNGEVSTCGKHYGERVGQLDDDTRFDDIWNGPAMRSLRETFNTPGMWRQCRECWLRELRWHAQRHEDDISDSVRLKKVQYTQASWDYRTYDDL